MICLPNYLVPQGRPELYGFGIVLCHPDDLDEIRREAEKMQQVVEERLREASEAWQGWWPSP